MIYFNGYPTCFLINTATKRWHPISFRIAPTPGQQAGDVFRYKSVGHHTEGFETIEGAIEFVESEKQFILVGSVFEWDGEDIPAMVLFFPADIPECNKAELIEAANTWKRDL